MDELLTVIQVMAYLKVCRATVQRWCKTGLLPAVKIGKEYRFRPTDLEQWYDSKRTKPVATATSADDAITAPSIALVPQTGNRGRGRPIGRQAAG